MQAETCPSCGAAADPTRPCPRCGAGAGSVATVLDEIEREIADLAAQDVAIARQRTDISQRIQAAMHRRTLLANAQERRERHQAAMRQQTRRRRTGPPPPRGPLPPVDDRAPYVDDSFAEPARPLPPETSARSTQNVLLILGALLLGVAATVFTGLTIGSVSALGRSGVLALAMVLLLAAPPRILARGLTATAETVAAVGFLLVALLGASLWAVPGGLPIPGQMYAALVLLVTAGVAAGYAVRTGLHVPRYATLLALQPVLPLLMYPWLRTDATLAIVFAVVAAIDLVLVRALPGRLSAWAHAPRPLPQRRPETAGEEPDALLDAGTIGRPEAEKRVADRPAGGSAAGHRPGWSSAQAAPMPPAAKFWLQETSWILYGVALLTALAAAASGLVLAGTVPLVIGAGVAAVLAAVVAIAGAREAGRGRILMDAALALLTVTIVAVFGRAAAVVLPGHAMLAITAAIALVAGAVAVVPAAMRRGPSWGVAVAWAGIGIVVASAALRAASATLTAARPIWHADLLGYVQRLSGPYDGQLVLAAGLLTVAVLGLPVGIRREWITAGVVLTGLAAPASLALPAVLAPWPPLGLAVALTAAALVAPRRRAVSTHLVGAVLLAGFAASAGLARPELTAAVLAAIAAAAVVLIVVARRVPLLGADPDAVADWSAAAVVLALPGLVAAVLSSGAASTPARLAGAALAVCVGLVFAAFTAVDRRTVPVPLSIAAGVGGLGVLLAGVRMSGATLVDLALGVLLVAAAGALLLAPTLDAKLRSDRLLDGADIAAATATAATIAVLARIAGLFAPSAALVAAALFTVVVSLAGRSLPVEWRRGPVVGIAVAGGLITLWTGGIALINGVRILTVPGPIWHGDVSAWLPAGADAWQAPVALILLAVAATITLPRPARYDVAALCVGLATVGTPAALGLPWWSPLVIDGVVATVYALAAVAARDARAGRARGAVATAVLLHAVGAGLVRPWTTALALTLVTALGLLVAALARPVAARTGRPGTRQLGGSALTVALLAAPGAVASTAATVGWPAEAALVAGMLAGAIGLGLVALVRRQIADYLPYVSAGTAGGATVLAFTALLTGDAAGFAAVAVLLGVCAELLREHTPARMPRRYLTSRRWLLRPPTGALAAAALPGLLAVAVLVPVVGAALTRPYATLGHRWQGPPPELLTLAAQSGVGVAEVLAALVLTVAAALAVLGFGGRRWASAVPVALPGVGITLLIAPLGLHLAWPAATLAALLVFVVLMLGVALAPLPPLAEQARPVRVARVVAFGFGLSAGGAGLAGSLATKPLTLITLAGAVGVGVVAALAGRSMLARTLGWLFAAVSAQAFALVAGLVAGWSIEWSACGVLAVGALLLIAATTLPRLDQPAALWERNAVEWSGHAAAVLALALTLGSSRYVAALLAAWGAVLGVAATRPHRPRLHRRVLFWSAIGCEVVAWWLLMWVVRVDLVEAYTLPFAAVALLIGLLELRRRPELGSWLAYGPALLSAFVPTVVILLTRDTNAVREIVLLLAGVATVIFGSMRRQQAPVVVGSAVTTVVALHALVLIGPWLTLIPVGLLLLYFGAANEKRRQDIRRLRGAITRMS